MSEIWDLNVTDASNTATGFGFPENMNPSDVNDNLRAILGALARWYGDTNGTLVSAGTGGAYTIASPNRSWTTSYSDGAVLMFQAHTVCSSAPTLAVDGKTAKVIMKNAAVTVSASDIIQDQICLVAYESTGDKWQLLSPVSGSGVAKQNDVITTRGDVIRGSSSGAAERLALGTTGYALTSDGTDAVFAQIAAAGLASDAVETAKIAAQAVTTPKVAGSVNAQTGTTYEFVSADAFKTVTMSNASANTATIATSASVSFATATRIDVLMLGAGTTKIDAASGVTLNGVANGSCDVSAQYSGVSLLKTGSDTWVVFGNRTDVA